VADIFFTTGKRKIVDHSISGTINLLTDTLKVMLADSTYTRQRGR
jgi:hypothetical protein